MKNPKLFSVIAATVAAVASFAPATALATKLTGEGGTNLGVGTTISAEAEGAVTWKSSFIGELKCNESQIGAKTTNEGSSSETVSASVETLTFGGCNGTLTVLKKGTLEIHTRTESADGNGTLTSTGTEITIELAGLHCIFFTASTDIGTITGSSTTNGNATLDVQSVAIPRTGGRQGAFCGSSATWSASYKFTTPSTLNIDGAAELKGEAPTGNVGETFTVSWRNVGGGSAVIDDEANSDGTVAETLGTGCETIVAGGSCTRREFKCLKKGESTLTIRDTPLVTGSVVVKCDELPLTGGPTTANVGETVTVTWKNHTETALVIEDETTSNGEVTETLGSSCGTIAATGSCTSRKIKCLKKGESTITAADTPSIEGSFVIKCD
jgi:hypothetical protein